MMLEDPKSISFSVMRVRQPIGDFYIGSVNAKDIYDISLFDIRKLVHKDGIDNYLGIQREVSPKRLKEIRSYVKNPDATFPTAVVLAVPQDCAEIEPIGVQDETDPIFFRMTLSNRPDADDLDGEPVLYRQIARVIDGQHRIAGLENYNGTDFEVNVAIFVGLDLANQASIFSTVNLAQTKVNKSLVYDLLALSEAHSPELFCHNITVSLDELDVSPFHERIKRLGKATEGRFNESLSQATVVEGLLRHICRNRDQVLDDRQIAKTHGKWKLPNAEEADRLVLRWFFVKERDEDVVLLMLNYFSAVAQRWPDAWHWSGNGRILNKTNGFRGLCRFFAPAYRYFAKPGDMVSQKQFFSLFEKVRLTDSDFNRERFLPGTSGETELFKTLLEETQVEQQ